MKIHPIPWQRIPKQVMTLTIAKRKILVLAFSSSLILLSLFYLNPPEREQSIVHALARWEEVVQDSEQVKSYKNCTPKDQIVFLKTHKCASSTIQNILLRRAVQENFNVALPMVGNYLGRYIPFHRSTLWGSPWAKANMSYNLFCLHTIWNYPEVKFVMGDLPERRNTYFSILRDPVELFISLWDYVQFPVYYGGHLSLEEYIMKKDKSKGRYRDRAKVANLGRNQMLFDFGLDKKDFDDEDKVWDKIKSIEDQFDLVLIAEKFDESMVLLKDLLCWDYRDVTYFKLNAKKPEAKSVISDEARAKLKQWLKSDYLLYNHFLAKFEKKVASFGVKKMKQEVKVLQAANDNVSKKCSVKAENNEDLTGSSKLWGKDMMGLTVSLENDAFCKFYGISEMSFIDYLRDIQSERAYTIIDKPNIIPKNPPLVPPLSVTKKGGSLDVERLQAIYG